jgi:hypothetical protein
LTGCAVDPPALLAYPLLGDVDAVTRAPHPVNAFLALAPADTTHPVIFCSSDCTA